MYLMAMVRMLSFANLELQHRLFGLLLTCMNLVGPTSGYASWATSLFYSMKEGGWRKGRQRLISKEHASPGNMLTNQAHRRFSHPEIRFTRRRPEVWHRRAGKWCCSGKRRATRLGTLSHGST